MPLFGDEIGLDAVQVPELGLVGSPLPSSPPAIEEALAAGLIPVVAPLGVGPLNVNADEAAAALAVGLGAERLLFITDVPGLLLGGARRRLDPASARPSGCSTPARSRAGSSRSCARPSVPRGRASTPTIGATAVLA